MSNTNPLSKFTFINHTTQIMRQMALYTAVKLDIADHLKESGQSVELLAEKIKCDKSILRRLLRYLVWQGYFDFKNNHYFLNDFSQRLCDDDPESYKALFSIFNERAMNSFNYLTAGIIANQASYSHLYGKDYFADLKADERSNQIYNRAMSNYSNGEGEAIVASYDFTPFQSVIDMGGGHSDLLSKIKDQLPSVEAILFDQPQVVRDKVEGFAPNITCVAGDFFKPLKIKGDCYILKRVLHDWDDKKALEILNNIRAVLTDNTKLLIIDAVLPDIHELNREVEGQDRLRYDCLLALDLQLFCLHGGLERTLTEFKDLLKKAKLTLQRVIQTSSLLSILEVKK